MGVSSSFSFASAASARYAAAVAGALADRVALVTGAASGIGRATAEVFAREGARVACADAGDTSGVVEAIAGAGGIGLGIRCDVSRDAEMKRAIEQVIERFSSLQVLVACAGIGGGVGYTADYAEEDFDRVVAVNLKGVFLAIKHALTPMLRCGGGSIVTIASVMGLVGLAGTPAYSASKGGVIQLTRSTAVAYASRGIRANCICPGMIDTPMVRRASAEARKFFTARQPLGRLGTAAEVARLALFLASDESSFATGAVFPLDGGYTAQ